MLNNFLKLIQDSLKFTTNFHLMNKVFKKIELKFPRSSWHSKFKIAKKEKVQLKEILTWLVVRLDNIFYPLKIIGNTFSPNVIHIL